MKKRRRVLAAMEESVEDVFIGQSGERAFYAACSVRYSRMNRAYFVVVTPTRVEGHSRMHFPEEVRSSLVENCVRFSAKRMKALVKELREKLKDPEHVAHSMVESCKKVIESRLRLEGVSA